MPSPYNITNIPAPRVDFIDPRTGLMAREWYRFFFNLFNLTGAGTTDTSLADLQVGPPAINAVLGELGITYDQAQLASMMAQYEQSIRDILNRIETAPAPPQLGTMAPLQQDWLPWVTFDTTPEGVPSAVGTVAWDGGTTLGVQMTTNVLGRVNESAYYYIKASSAITKGEVIMFTGAVGASGVPTGAPATGVTDGSYIMGIAAESIALNGFGLVQFAGTLKGVDTAAFLDGDILWYDPAVTGGLTKTKPSAPNVKVQMAAVIKAGSGGSGSILIRVNAGSVLGGTDSNVQFGTLTDKDLIQYDGALQYWKNVAPSSIAIGTATNLAGGAAGSVPYQSGAGATTFLSIGIAGQYAKVNAGATAPEWASPGALTKTDDTNVTLTLGGSASTALLNAASITVGWTGTLAATRLNANVVQAVTNDTNVTGSIATQTLTLGWTGQLSLARGGTNASLTASAGSVAYSTATALALNTAGNSGDWLKSGGTAAPTWTAPAALTKTDDTNVTLTLGGSASTALLNAASITVGWTGTLAVSRGGTGASTASITSFNNITGYTATGATGTTSTNIVFSGSPTIATPTITTSATVPLVIGGTGTTSTLTLRSTSGVGTTGADIVFQVGNNGATEAARILNSGNVGIGTTSPAQKLHVNGSIRGTSDFELADSGNTVRGYVFGASTGVYYRSTSGLPHIWQEVGTELARLTTAKNFKIGGTAERATTVGTNHLDIYNGTAPVGTLTNGISIYSSSGEAYVMDAAGNATLFSPHDAKTNEWIFKSKHTPTGKVLKIDVEKMLRFINDHFGLDMIQEFIED